MPASRISELLAVFVFRIIAMPVHGYMAIAISVLRAHIIKNNGLGLINGVSPQPFGSAIFHRCYESVAVRRALRDPHCLIYALKP
jgi:hypothetical protein